MPEYRAHLESGEYAKAYDLLERLQMNNDATSQDIRLAADCMIHLDRVDDGIQILLDYAENHPKDHEIYRKLGMIYLNEKQAREVGLNYLQLSLSLENDQPDLTRLLAQIQRKTVENAAPQAPQPGVPSVNPAAPNVPNPRSPLP